MSKLKSIRRRMQTGRRLFQVMARSLVIVALATPCLCRAQDSEREETSVYDVLLHSHSLTDQRKALAEVVREPRNYVPLIQASLRDYPRTLRTDRVAASRAVYISALVRDASFPSLLVNILGNPDVLEECEYPCPVVFALTIQASFAGWGVPSSLDSQLTTVSDLKSSIQNVSHINLNVGSIEDIVQGAALDDHKKEIQGKTEDELLQLASPTTPSAETRLFAAYRLETLITNSRNRIELYLLTLNDVRDVSGEYRDAVYQAIYRAELAGAGSEATAKGMKK